MLTSGTHGSVGVVVPFGYGMLIGKRLSRGSPALKDWSPWDKTSRS